MRGMDLFFTFSASWIGGASLILLTEKAVKIGLYAFLIIPVPTILTLIILYLIGKKVKEFDFFYIEDIISRKYGKSFGSFSSIVFLWYLILLGASQLVALGKVGESFLGVKYSVFIFLSAALVIFYSAIRGFEAVIRTDKIQFLLIVIGVCFLFIYSLKYEKFNGRSFVGEGFSSSFLLMVISFTMAWTVSPISLQRIKASKSVNEIRRGIILSLLFLTIIFIMIISSGIFLKKSILSFQNTTILSPFIFLLLLSALFSTYDTVLNSAAISLKFLAKTSNIFSTIVVGILSIVISLKIPSILKTLGLSSEIIAESLFIPIVYSLFSRKENRLGGQIVILLGFALSLFSFSSELFSLKTYFKWPYSILISLPLLFFVFMLSFLRKEKRNE